MAEHNDFGMQGEECAASYLLSRGYRILERNWQCGHRELDIICEKSGSNKLIIIEVKSRKYKSVRLDELIDYQKIKNIRFAADAYIRRFEVQREVQFDVIVITGEEKDVEHLENIISVID